MRNRRTSSDGPQQPAFPNNRQGQGRAPGPLCERELLLWPGLRVGRRRQRAGAAVGRRGRQRAGPRDAPRAHRRPLRAGEAATRPLGPASIPAGRAEARAFAGASPGAARPHNPKGRGRAPPSGRLRAHRGEIAVKAPSRRQRIAAQLADRLGRREPRHRPPRPAPRRALQRTRHLQRPLRTRLTLLTSNKGLRTLGRDPARRGHGDRSPRPDPPRAASSTSGATASGCGVT